QPIPLLHTSAPCGRPISPALPPLRRGRTIPPVLKDRRREPINWRSVLLGLIGVTIICALTPYNDYALNNTFLIGNNLPLGVVMLTFLFVVLVNGPLNRWWPGKAFTA